MNRDGKGDFAITVRVHSHLRYTDLFHTVLSQVAREVALPEERLDWIALALREAVNNAVLHGNANDPSKWVQVDMETCGKTLTLRVWDEGHGFSSDVLKDPTSPENIFKPNGRGIFLIRQFVDDLEFARDESGRFAIVMGVDLTKNKGKEESR